MGSSPCGMEETGQDLKDSGVALLLERDTGDPGGNLTRGEPSG